MNHRQRPAHPTYPPTLGARLLGDGRCRFLVWAPCAKRLDVRLLGDDERLVALEPRDDGYFERVVDAVSPGTRYFFRIDGDQDRPDPASRFQPEGVHKASAVVDPAFPWTDDRWRGIPLHDYITYELHVGTFTPAGTFAAAMDLLDEIVDLGVTAIELMPIAQFPGGRNWGYDGVHPYAVQNTYGGPVGLKQFVNAAHQRNLAVIVDAVYNHLGPEGNYLAEFGPYFTDRYQTPWGPAINYDDRGSDEVRRFFIENALYWIQEFHVDALRLDAVHAIFDFSARPFLQELADAVRLEGERLNRRVYTIAESSLGDPKLITPKELGGIGIDSQWCDDLHHALHTELTEDRSGYYADYRGYDDIVGAFQTGFVQQGARSVYRERRHGASARHIHPSKIVVCSQNHDQVGNRLLGERLSAAVTFEAQKLAAATVILSPYQPLLFMGEEYGETAPFQFFVSHADQELVAAVRAGRRQEFARFNWKSEPPDPQDEATFQRCKLNHALRHEGRHRVLRGYYQQLIALRRSESALAFSDRERMDVWQLATARGMAVRCRTRESQIMSVFHFGESAGTADVPFDAGCWHKIIDSSDPRWNGPGSSLPSQIECKGPVPLELAMHSVVVYRRAKSEENL